MLTDQFLNLICLVCVADNKDFTGETARHCKQVLEFYKKQEDDVPLQSRLKFELADTLCDLKIDGKSKDTIIDNVRTMGKFKDLDSLIVTMSTRKINDSKADECCREIADRKKLIVSLSDFGQLRKFVDDFQSHGFESIQAALSAYESTITELYSNFSAERRTEDTRHVKSLDLFGGDYSRIIHQIQTNYSCEFSVTTGYPDLDRYLRGGFHPGRLYVFGGSSGDGKSTTMINFLKNNLKRKKEDELYDLYVYFTLENQLDESLLKLYCSLENLSDEEIIDDYESHKQLIPQKFTSYQRESKTILTMDYFPATSVSVMDLIIRIEELKSQYEGVAELRGIFVDYLDLLKAGRMFDIYRMELGQITVDLKVLAVTMHVPVVTLTQLNRAGYAKDAPMDLTMMSESIKKVEHADFVALLRARVMENDDGEEDLDNDEGILDIEICKNRSGPKNKRVTLATNFSKSLIWDTGRRIAPPGKKKKKKKKVEEITFDGDSIL